jgi:hypothetical protein
MGHSDGKGCSGQEEEHGGWQEFDKGAERQEEQDDCLIWGGFVWGNICHYGDALQSIGRAFIFF